MKVYILDADVNNYRGLYFAARKGGIEFDLRFVGAPMKNGWRVEKRLQFVPRRLLKGDTPGLSTHIPVFNRKAVKSLNHFLDQNGELLPATCQGEEYFLFNVTRVVDALDEANCDLERFDDGRIMIIRRYSFFPKKLEGITIFKVPQIVLMDVFVTEPFVQRVQSEGLKGFKFRHVWTGDAS